MSAESLSVTDNRTGIEYEIAIAIGRGATEVTVLTCDFSYDYVKINAEYRT